MLECPANATIMHKGQPVSERGMTAAQLRRALGLK